MYVCVCWSEELKFKKKRWERCMMMILLINMKFNIPVCFLSFTQQLFPPSAPPPSNVSHGADRRKQFYLNSFELWVTGCVVQTQHYQHLMAIDAAPAEEWGARASQKKASIKTAECHRNHPVSLILNAKNKSSSRQQTSQPKNLIPFASYLWLSLHFFSFWHYIDFVYTKRFHWLITRV